MIYECFDVAIEAGVAHIQLKRPEAMNSMNRAFWRELPAILDDIDENALARCVVISSTGKHFTAGMDLAVFSSPAHGATTGTAEPSRPIAAEAMRYGLLRQQTCFTRLDEARMPVLVAVQGGCVGGGVDMISACDIRYATADAFFCIQEINIGMTADVGTFPRLCRLIPQGWVREMAYTGRRLPAAKALEIGLVNAVFDTQAAMIDSVLETAREIASKAPLAVTGSKAMINYAREHSTADALDYLSVWQSAAHSRSVMREAMAAKREGRPANFADLLPKRKSMIE